MFFTKELSKSFSARNTIQEIFSSIFLSGLLHAAGIAVFHRCGYEIDVKLVLQLLFDPESIDDYSSIATHQEDVAFYFFTVSIGAAILSYLFRNTIRTMQWDRRWEFLRFDNTWYYLFSGEAAQIRKYQVQHNRKDGYRLPNQRFVDVLTKSGEKRYLYTGNLVDYQLGADNRLEYIVISSPSRQLVREKEDEAIVKKQITSEYFVIPFSEILNINVRYLYLEEDAAHVSKAKVENQQSRPSGGNPENVSNSSSKPSRSSTQSRKGKTSRRR